MPTWCGRLRDVATAVRFLGNLGLGRDPLPAETVTQGRGLIRAGIYDVYAVSVRLILKGGLRHHLAVSGCACARILIMCQSCVSASARKADRTLGGSAGNA
jgi:hypothetical protein